ncbi:MAG: hypothetical protein HRU70_05075 [Phycisphaeraceae bacterium]|nr:MAG: hypothetical protein HRU70_05075 [Phycisphaeraceae bacterium]
MNVLGLYPCSVALAAATPAIAQPALVSDFTFDREGWIVETRSNPTGPFTIIQGYVPTHVATGGDPGGYIEQLDPDSNWSFFASPNDWAGDRSSFYGRTFEYSVRTDTLNYPDGRLVVLIGAGGQRISHATDLPPLNAWSRRAIPLAEGSWRVGSSATGAVASQAQITAILASLQRVLIGMEFGGDALEERVGIDRVRFGVCAADFNDDNFLDFFDLDAFVACFEFGECPPGKSADVNGDGFLDFFDLDAYIEAFEAGC